VTGPNFDELVGGDLGRDERERLLRVHELLIAAGPPPELSPELATAPPEPKASVVPIHRHRWRTAAIAVAATLLIAFGAGWLIGGRGSADHIQRTVAMSGPHGAKASLEVLRADDAGNWPMRMTVSGLPQLPSGKTYTLWLTKNGKLDSPCGNFVVGKGTTTVKLNAPYHLKEYSGWVVVPQGSAVPVLRTGTI
jgi:Anti-sigma-K factor rskA, C-terminal